MTDPEGRKTLVTYLVVNSNGSYIWGIDSAETDPLKNITKGTWEVTSDGDLEFIPENTKNKTSYYSKTGDVYKYDGYEENGKKKHAALQGMTVSIQKMAALYQEK